eukprot:1158294-Pyramimonas_sp.AAC.1
MEYNDVVRQQEGQTTHVRRLLAFLVEKISVLSVRRKDRKYKDRVVFDGSDVRDHNRDVALVQGLSCSPATMQAG